MAFLCELFQFLSQRKKLWLLPIIFILIALGATFLPSTGSLVIAPFIYTLF